MEEISYEFKEEPIQLVSVKDGILETTAEAINILTYLKNSKIKILSINGPLGSGKSTLANNLINKAESGFKVGEKMEGIWIWGKPISLNDDIKLLILDCQGINNSKDNEDNISHKLFILSVLLSTSVVYMTKGELTNDIIKDFLCFTDISSKIKIEEEKENNQTNNNLKDYLPEIYFINDTLNKENIQNLIEKEPEHEKFYNLFENRNYLKIDEHNDIMNKLKSDNNYKKIQNNIIDGDDLFGLLQNYIDFMNNNETPIINSALQNVLLSKSNKESELIIDKFKNSLNKTFENKYPISITNIYKVYHDLQRKYTSDFFKNVENYLKINQVGEYLKTIFKNMEKELETVLETNKDYYDDWFAMEYKELGEVMEKIKLESNDNIKKYFSNFISTIQTCFNKFLNIPNVEFCKNLIAILSKIFQEFIGGKLIKIGDEINTIYETYSKKNTIEIESLKNEIKKLKEQIESNEKLLGNKPSSGKNYLELESKLEKMNHDMKEQKKEYENNINIEIQKYQKFEEYVGTQIKEKDKKISELEKKIENLTQEILLSNNDSLKKGTELNKLQTEINLMKKESFEAIEQKHESGIGFQNLLINIQNTFMNFKESVDKLDKENENIFKLKNLENNTKLVEEKFESCTSNIKNFCQNQIKELGENYEKELNKIKNDYDIINFELVKKNMEINEANKSKEIFEMKIKETEKQINELSEISKSKDDLIQTQNQTLKTYEDKINEYKKMKEDLELSLAKNIYNFKMKEDEFDSLFMVIEGIVSRKKEKYEHNLNKLSPEAKTMVETLVKQYKFFK